MPDLKKEFMEAAIAEAKKAREAGDYAIGAVVARGNEIIARAENRVKTSQTRPIARSSCARSASGFSTLLRFRIFPFRYLADVDLDGIRPPKARTLP